MKNFRITVNGNTYDVAVEELGETAGNIQNTVTSPINVPVKTSEPPKAAPSSGAEGGTKISAPMPGSILDIKVSVGDKVNANDVVVILEAMKMENEIVTPVAGTVASINVSKSASVNSGDVLVTIAE